MSLNFDHNSNLFRVNSFHTEKMVKMSQYYSDSSRFFCNQLYTHKHILITPVLSGASGTYYAGQKILAVIFCHFKEKNIYNPYLIVIWLPS
jgi:hypothetical protein